MSKHIAFLSAAAAGTALLAGAVLPAAAADYYGGFDGGDRPLSYHSRDDVTIEGGRARVEHRQDLRPADGDRRGPGPVVFDERGSGYGDPAYRRPVAVERFGLERPPGFVPNVERPYGGEIGYSGYGGYGGYGRYGGYGGGYRPAAVAVGPAYGGGFGAGYGAGVGAPDEGCTVERARSYTPAGWEKTVTRRTCFRR